MSNKSEWEFNENEINILDGDKGLLGKGAYGEVRLAVW